MASALHFLVLVSLFLSCQAKALHKLQETLEHSKAKLALRHSPTVVFIPKESIVGAVENDKLEPAVPVPISRIHTPVLQKLQEKLDHVHDQVEVKRERLEVLRQHLVNQTEQLFRQTEHMIKSVMAQHKGQLAFVPKNWETFNSSDPNDPLSAAPAGYVPVIIYGLPTADSKSVPDVAAQPATESASDTSAIVVEAAE